MYSNGPLHMAVQRQGGQLEPTYSGSVRIRDVSITQECYEQYWISPGGNTPQGTNYTATCLPSRKLSKLYEPDMHDTAGEAKMSS